MVYVTGGGSGFGVKGLHERHHRPRHGVARPAGRRRSRRSAARCTHVFARDAVAIATSTTSPLAKTKQELHHRRAGRDLLRPGGAVLADRQPPAGEADGAAHARRQRRRHRDLPGARDEAAALRRFAPAVSVDRGAHQEARDERRGDRVRFGRRGQPGQSDLRTYAVDGVSPTQDNIVNGSYSLNRPMLIVAKPSPAAQGAALHGLRAGRLPGDGEGDGLRPGRAPGSERDSALQRCCARIARSRWRAP